MNLMSIEDLDLDINNYNMRDLETFFNLHSNANYKPADIEEKEYAMRTLLLSSGEVSKKQQKDLIHFLTLARDWLIFVKCKPNKLQPIQDNSFDNQPSIRNNELNPRDTTMYLNTQNSDVFPGVINPLNTRILVKSLNIDTRFRDLDSKSTSTDFIYNLPSKLNKVVSMHLSSLELPLHFYGISEKLNNNYLHIDVYHKSNFSQITSSEDYTTTSKTIILPDGNYSSSELITTINQLIGSDPNNPNSNDIFSYIKFSLDIKSDGSGTSKVKISPTGVYAENIDSISLDFRKNIKGLIDRSIPYYYRIGTNLGFTKPDYNSNNTNFLESESIINPLAIRYLYLLVNDYNNNVNEHFIGTFNKSLMTGNILARISIHGSYFSIMKNDEFNITSEPRKYFGPVDIQKLHIRLCDEFGRTIDLNHSDFSFCLNFRLIYDL
jgi:hypothetical protein